MCGSLRIIKIGGEEFSANEEYMKDLVRIILENLDVTNPKFSVPDTRKEFLATTSLHRVYSKLIQEFRHAKKSQLTFDKADKEGYFIDLLTFFEEKVDEVLEKLKVKDKKKKD